MSSAESYGGPGDEPRACYNAFGDKEGVFRAAFTHYNEVVLNGRLDRYAPAEAGMAGVREAFGSLLHEPDGGSFG